MARVRAKPSCLRKWTMTRRGESLRATYRFRCEYRDPRLRLLDRRVPSSLEAFDWGTLEWRGVLWALHGRGGVFIQGCYHGFWA